MEDFGVDLDVCEFNKLKSKDRDTVIFKNMVHLRSKSKGDYVERRLHRYWLLVLTILFGAKKFIGF